MSEAPKKMWVHEGFWRSGDSDYWTSDEKENEEETLYIREDLVDALVQALEGMLDWFGYPEDHECSRSDKARAALAKLEESHE